MGVKRRDFFKIAGVTALSALTATKAVSAFAFGPSGHGGETVSKDNAVRWAMVIDTRKCGKGAQCKNCPSLRACHEAHNVPDIPNKKHEVKWIWQDSYDHAFPTQTHALIKDELKTRPVMLLCNHCDNPPCVRVCPTKATFKREQDGLVMMDQHRCIGCRYCMSGCPYGARSFNWVEPKPHIKKINRAYPVRTLGVVEKCTFCAERLAKNQGPICVEACPEKAIVFGNLNDPKSEVRKILSVSDSVRRKPHLGTSPEVYYIM
ncbi:MAG: 4Fe-4S dicluster domain-containing protein [Deltaproteobacteria bacterium]|nr:4Fe-4S dicluster domain-containing protein [Deltaproteobacteria bacterium]